MSFFEDERSHFFRPLAGPRRVQVLECLKAFYERLYAADPALPPHVEREELRELLADTLAALPAAAERAEGEEDDGPRRGGPGELAAHVIRLLQQHGWIEEYLDKSVMVRGYRLTRCGKAFARTFEALSGRAMETRQRHVRNARNALATFAGAQAPDPYDLMDAHAYAQRIVEDLTDDIAELNERKREVMRSAAGKAALEDFLAYMEQFQADTAVRLAADSVERHGQTILDAAAAIRAWPQARTAPVDERLRPLVQEALGVGPEQSPTRVLVAGIEQALDAARTSRLPELRRALAGFARTATQMIRQTTALRAGRGEEALTRAIRAVAARGREGGEAQDRLLEALAGAVNGAAAALVDPGDIRIRRRTLRREVSTASVVPEPSRGDLLRLAMDQAEQVAFAVSPQQVREDLTERVRREGVVRLSDLVLTDPPSVLGLVHAIEAASSSLTGDGLRLAVRPLGRTFETPYLTAEDYEIRLAKD